MMWIHVRIVADEQADKQADEQEAICAIKST